MLKLGMLGELPHPWLTVLSVIPRVYSWVQHPHYRRYSSPPAWGANWHIRVSCSLSQRVENSCLGKSWAGQPLRTFASAPAPRTGSLVLRPGRGIQKGTHSTGLLKHLLRNPLAWGYCSRISDLWRTAPADSPALGVLLLLKVSANPRLRGQTGAGSTVHQ